MRKYMVLTGILFIITLAVVVGFRLSADAMAVVVGIILGLLASIPTSIMLIWMLRQRDRQFEVQFGQGRGLGQPMPPVVVVNGQIPNGYQGGSTPNLLPSSISGGREFKIIGQENTETIGDVLPPFWDEL